MNSILITFLVVIACSCFYYLKNEKKKYNTIVYAIYFLVFGICCYLFVSKLIYRFNKPEVWDFTAFYLWGKEAVEGYNFYLPENSNHVFNTLNLPDLNYETFIANIVDVGFLYPPPTILYFIPLGYLSYNTALICWMLINLIFVIGCIYLIYSIFLKSEKFNGLLLVVILFFVFSPVRATVFYSQTNFILLFYLLLMYKYSDTRVAGIFLALALFTKPYMIIFLVFFIIKKNWKAIIYFLATSLALIGVTLTVFGAAPFASYLYDNPSKRLPRGAFLEDINQSLHSVLLRSNLISIEKPFLFICIVSVILITALLYIIYLKSKKLYDYIWAVLLLIGLILYPGTLSHYAVLLLFIIFQFIDKKQLGFNSIIMVPIVGAFYFLSIKLTFAAICFLLLVIIIKSIYSLKEIRIENSMSLI